MLVSGNWGIFERRQLVERAAWEAVAVDRGGGREQQREEEEEKIVVDRRIEAHCAKLGSATGGRGKRRRKEEREGIEGLVDTNVAKVLEDIVVLQTRKTKTIDDGDCSSAGRLSC